jgi:hypothetical protein
MPLSRDEIAKRIKAPEKDSLKYKILEFFERAEKTDTPAYSIEEVTDALGYDKNFSTGFTFSLIIQELIKEGRISEAPPVKNDAKKYYMTKDAVRPKVNTQPQNKKRP